MMRDISGSLPVLEKEDGDLVVTEFIIGYRIYVDVTDNKIQLRQDEAYNRKNFGQVLNLDNLWPTLEKNYGIDTDSMFHAPVREYTLNCIMWDQFALSNKVPIYPERGFVVVEIVPQNGILIHQSKIPEFCQILKIPCVKVLFSGRVDYLKGELKHLRSTSNISINKIGGGIVIKNEPVQTEGGAIKRFYVKPDLTDSTEIESETVEDMANECVRSLISTVGEKAPENLVLELENNTGVSPVKIKKFATVITNFLKTERIGEYEEYKHRCLPLLGSDPDTKFETVIKQTAEAFIKDTVLKMNRYELQVVKKSPRKYPIKNSILRDAPPPPENLVGAMQDTVHKDLKGARAGKSTRAKKVKKDEL